MKTSAVRRIWFVVVGVLVAASALPATARAAQTACGTVVTTDLTLSAPMSGCAEGLILGADGITVDLNGFSIDGTGAEGSVGILAENRTGVSVMNGTISGFATAVALRDSAYSAVQNLRITDSGAGVLVGLGSANSVGANTIEKTGTGVSVIGSPATRVVGNSVTDSGVGIFCRFTEQSPVTYFEHNATSANGTGVSLQFCPSLVRRNVSSHNAGSGFVRFRSPGDFLRNVANGNGGSGIEAEDSHGRYLRNVTNANAAYGFVISDQSPSHGPFHTIADHVANANGLLGIAVFNLVGVVESGRNRAHANGDPAECFGIVCN